MAVTYDSANSGNVNVGTVTAGSTATVTLPHAIPVGEAACIAIGFGGSTSNISSITDTPGNTYTKVDFLYSGSPTSFGFTTYICLNTQGTPSSVVLHNTGAGNATFVYFLIDLFAGVAGSSALDGHNIQNQVKPGTGTNAISSGNFSPATSGDLIWGASVNVNSHATETQGTGFSAGQSNVNSSYWTEYKLSGASGSQACTFTDSFGGSGNYISAGLALKAAANIINGVRFFPAFPFGGMLAPALGWRFVRAVRDNPTLPRRSIFLPARPRKL